MVRLTISASTLPWDFPCEEGKDHSPVTCAEPLRGKRICVIGGEDLHLRIPFLKRLQKAGLDVTAVATARRQQFESDGISFVEYRMKRTVDPVADLCTLDELRKLLARIRPTIVHAFDTKPSIYGIWAAALAGVPIRIRTITGRGSIFVEQGLRNRLLRVLLRWMHQLAGKCATVTAFYNRDDLEFAVSRGLTSARKAVLVPGSGIDLEAFVAQVPDQEDQLELRRKLAGPGQTVTLMVSRLLREKGVIEYLTAARTVRHQLPTARFYLVGAIEPAGRQTLREEEILSFADDVTWLGRREDVPALLSIADLVVLPTYYGEGIPRVILEAGACRRAVVATKVPGCVDVIDCGRNGWLVPPKDPVTLAGIIKLALTDEDTRLRLGENLFADVRSKFSLDRIFRIWLTIYSRCLAEAAYATHH
ncbi:MAG: glycosyltransferase family 4 protein [Thermoguttaceae bacterium]|nr:glycosyltransferase family 4 protein [Thermoguttaceae bacterium]